MKRLYVGRPVSLFNTKEDDLLIEAIKERFSSYKIEDPNQLKHQEGYKRYKSLVGKIVGEKVVKSGMDYYYREVLPNIDAGVFVPFQDRMIGAGVVGEAEFLKDAGKLVFEVQFDWKKSGRLHVFHWSSDSSRFLSPEETRSRIYIGGDYKLGIKSFFEESKLS